MIVPAIQSRSLSIFLVEDHADTLNFLRMYLRNLGHTVFHATSMTDALTAVPEARCDVLISDVGLPDGDGWELLRRLKEDGLVHPSFAIAMSGFGMSADRVKSEKAGYRRHLLKPFNPDELESMLEEAARGLEVADGHIGGRGSEAFSYSAAS